MTVPTVVSYGGGTNSTSLLIGMKEREWRPDLILFADTGGEKPHTYLHVELMSEWCRSVGFPPILVVRNINREGEIETLEEMCLRTYGLPSVAFGWKTCSQRYKLQPQHNYLESWGPARKAWREGTKVLKLIGFDADEPQRAKNYDDEKYEQRYPLVEWGWGREECVEAIQKEGLELPGKSACFFCPNSKAWEILDLQKRYPDLYKRAIEMEINASPNLITVKGLGRNKSWTEVVESKESCQVGTDQPCGCYDGD